MFTRLGKRGVIVLAVLLASSGCRYSQESSPSEAQPADAPGEGRGPAGQPGDIAALQRILVDAMPVSAQVGDDIGNDASQHVRVVTVRLANSMGQPANFERGQEFSVQYFVTDANNVVVANNDIVVKPNSPRHHKPPGNPASSFEFRIYAKKGTGAAHKVKVYVSYLRAGALSNEFTARP